MAQGRIESRLVVTAVVVDPAADVTVEHPSKIIQRLVAVIDGAPSVEQFARIDLRALPLTAGLNETPNPFLLRDSRGRNGRVGRRGLHLRPLAERCVETFSPHYRSHQANVPVMPSCFSALNLQTRFFLSQFLQKANSLRIL